METLDLPVVRMVRLLGWIGVILLHALVGAPLVLCETDPQDVAALRSLMSGWKNIPPSWGVSGDPCGTSPWDGVKCTDSRVVTLQLSSMNLQGKIEGDIGRLTGLQTLDLSYNVDLGGPLTPSIGSLKNLRTLILAGCSFTGNIPEELGTLPLLSFLALNTNKFIGKIPASLGSLSNLYWFDISENQLNGPLPVSSGTTPGLDKLFNAKHFHFNKNQLSGSIPPEIFNSNMTLIHVLFDGNQLSGSIPDTIGLVTTLEALRLDRNRLIGPIPTSISNLASINEMHLSNNKLTGTIPNLSGMENLNYLDLSNNSFTPSVFPNWFASLGALTTLALESSSLIGRPPYSLFSVPQLQTIYLKNNNLNGTLDLPDTISQQLRFVDLENNDISFVSPKALTSVTLILKGNPVCASAALNTKYCQLQQQSGNAYSTSVAHCGLKICPDGESVAPFSCQCAYPYQGLMLFRAPSFSDLANSTRFQSLESSLWTKLQLASRSVIIQGLKFNSDNYLQMELSLFPSSGTRFSRIEIQKLGFSLSNQTYKPPQEYGTYKFQAYPYFFSCINYPLINSSDDTGGKSSFAKGAIAGIVAACSALFIGLVIVGLYAINQKKRANKAVEIANPFASWTPSNTHPAGAPQLKGTRFFTFEDMKKCTNNFSESNEIGVGGYGKVYKATIPSGEVVAIKRAKIGSMQGATEFKTEIELLSRVHHKNLVVLVGFCYDKVEQMLVYEHISNGTLRDNLSGKTGIILDWNRRLKIALDSAKGLAYLHELANPPIIHRDIKSMNILLDDTLVAKVADFGLSKLVSDDQEYVSTQVKGTLGYLDPEYFMTQKLTEKSDVFSFGVVMLELITSRLPIEKGKYVVKEVRELQDQSDKVHCGLSTIMDPILLNMHLIGFTRFLKLALSCVQETASQRPKMSVVVKEIEAILDEGFAMHSASSPTPDSGNKTVSPAYIYEQSLDSGWVSSDNFRNSSISFSS